MKILGLILTVGLLVSGCATYQHSEYIDTDQLQGYASGRYNLNSSGASGSFVMGGAGGGGNLGGGGGFGGGAFSVTSGPPEITPYNFAKSVAMINYSKKLKSIKYDETGGIVEYQFDHDLLPRKTSYQPTVGRSSLPASFGHQPIE
jgi:hypothetical protein